jgi:hypothetical protein
VASGAEKPWPNRSELVVSANNAAIRVKDREYSCPTNGAPEELLRETDE